jgi:methylmalonyl-CoA/ethylmalonyl-CoA epimerase
VVPPAGFDGLIERFDHAAIGLWDVRRGLPLMELLGGDFLQGGDNLRNRFRWVQFTLPGGSKLELLAPLEGNAFLTGFLERRGEGLHHLTFKVSDLRAAVARAEELGFEVTGLHEDPAWSEAFLHPRSAGGSLIQLAAWDGTAAWAGPGLDDVLAGRSIDAS